MSGIYIPDMEMPSRCFACPLCDTDCCGISKGPYIEYREVDIEVAVNGRPDWCPLIPVPDHGRLIDADDIENIKVVMNENGIGFKRIVAPTIIPADKEAN